MKHIAINCILLLLYFISFSLGDELGFPESIGNVEGSRRRALNLKTSSNAIGSTVVKTPTIHPTKIQQSRPQAVTSQYQMLQYQSTPHRPVISTPQGFQRPQYVTQATPLEGSTVPPFKPIPSETLQVKDNILQPSIHANNYRHYNKRTNIQNVNDDRVNYGSQLTINDVPSFKGISQDISKITSQAAIQDQAEFPDIDLKGHTIEELAAFANVSVDVIKTAIKMRQDQMKSAQKSTLSKRKTAVSSSTTATPLSTTQRTTKFTVPTIPQTTPKKKATKYVYTNGHKVMNAPKEYYPAGYDKNFDDNFKSKVDLPATSFHCGDQKHFPGLYADEELGCMVFHVCALTDDGLIMKSFLCPESTLFDQTILKCNWWFYTDCKSSKNLYDSNLPVSKSYQLMKSLAFFNANYKKTGNGTDESEGIDVQSLRNSVS